MKRVLSFSLLILFLAPKGSAEDGAVMPVHIPEEHEDVRELLESTDVKERKERWWSMTVGGFFRSQAVKRGAQIWPAPSAAAGPYFSFFNVIQIRGPNVSYRPFSRKNSHQVEMGLQHFDDDKPFGAIGSHEEDHRNQRAETWEASFKYSYGFGLRNAFKVGGKVIRDIDENEGLFGEAFLQVPVYRFISFKYTLGLAESSQATYLYGPEAESGSAYHRGEFSLVWPMLPWEGIIMNRLSWSSVLQGENRHADYVRGEYEQVSLSFMVIWNVF